MLSKQSSRWSLLVCKQETRQISAKSTITASMDRTSSSFFSRSSTSQASKSYRVAITTSTQSQWRIHLRTKSSLAKWTSSSLTRNSSKHKSFQRQTAMAWSHGAMQGATLQHSLAVTTTMPRSKSSDSNSEEWRKTKNCWTSVFWLTKTTVRKQVATIRMGKTEAGEAMH